jgi:hypothetical protein
VSAESFSSEVSRKLGWYVYRLIDPRTGETFYVGKSRLTPHVFPRRNAKRL